MIEQIIKKLPLDRIWINPDCGLKTRSEEESFASLRNIVEATRKVRSSVNETNGAF